MKARKTTALGLGALAVALILSGCADPSTSGDGGGESPVASTRTPSPAKDRSLESLTRSAPCTPPRHVVRGDRRRIVAFHPVAAVRCTDAERRYPHEGEWTVSIRQATGKGIADLVSALDQPDRKAPKDQICTSVFIATPSLVLVDAGGHHLYPRFPLDECHQPQGRARDQVDGMQWRTILIRRERQQFTQAQLDSHCAPAWKNELYYDARFNASRSSGGPVFTFHPHAPLHACLFHTSAAAIDMGKFVGGRTLNAAQSDRMRAALSLGAPSGSCPAQRDFAVIATSPGDSVNVELGGCWRVHRDAGPGTVGGADATAIRDLLSLK